MAGRVRGRRVKQLAIAGTAAAAIMAGLAWLAQAAPAIEAYLARPEGEPLPVGAVSADGLYTASLRNDGAVEIRDADGQLQGIVRGHGAPVVQVAFAGEGDRLKVRTLDAEGRHQETALSPSLAARSAASGHAPLLRRWTRDRVWAPAGRPVAAAMKSAHQAIDPYAGAEFRAPEMVVLPPGSFVMGSPEDEEGRFGNEGPQRTVRIGYSLAVGKHEVTWDEWTACVSDGGCGGYRPPDQGWGRGSRPVINVSWEDAQSYLEWLNEKMGLAGRPEAFRLLTEAEWEYAARAGSAARWSFGEDEGRLGDHAWFDENSGGRTQPVGGKAVNAFGLHDMHGNVWEWTEDCWRASYDGAPSDGSARTTGDCSDRVLRGGSWYNSPQGLRSALRDWDAPGHRGSDLGFRVARTLPP